MTTPARPLYQKIGIKDDMHGLLVNAPEVVEHALAQSKASFTKDLSGEFDYIHLFTDTQKQFRSKFPIAKKHLKPFGMLWVSWPKSKQAETDLDMFKIIELGYEFGLVESKVVSVDRKWSAIKFTHPKKGKEYHNSYGKLK